ncbi:hypothetical protein [Nakamurella lactea]|uniref:hypothetical protein n=1 Tax=Nakamurella lactea TaxID=459515 RepID=UPI00042507C0|nr:hypothetical protein [Nakamurella lactea]
MTIQLSDIVTATSDYLHDQVEVRIGRVTGNLEAGESGTWTVRWTNAAAPTGVRLRDVFLHLTVDPGSVALIKPPGSAILQPRATADINDPRLNSNTLVDEMFVFLPDPGVAANPLAFDSRLDVGESVELEFDYQAIGAGRATFSGHIHAAVDLDDLFPNGRGDAGSKDVTVLVESQRVGTQA